MFAADSDDDLVKIRGAEAVAMLRDVLRFEAVEPAADTSKEIGTIALRMTKPPPAPLAFDVYLWQAHGRVKWGPLLAEAGRTNVSPNLPTAPLARLVEGPVWVDLEPLKSWGRLSTDLRYIDERLELGPVEFRGSATRQPTSSAASAP